MCGVWMVFKLVGGCCSRAYGQEAGKLQCSVEGREGGYGDGLCGHEGLGRKLCSGHILGVVVGGERDRGGVGCEGCISGRGGHIAKLGVGKAMDCCVWH